MLLISLQVVSGVADMSDKVDDSSTSLMSKDIEPASESLSAMDDATQPQVQSMDTSCDLDGSLGDVTRLKADVNFGPAADEVICSKPAGSEMAESCMSYESMPCSDDVVMQTNVGECSPRVEIASHKNAESCDVLGEEELHSVQKEDNVEAIAKDEVKSPVCQTAEESEVSSATDKIPLNDVKEDSLPELSVQLAAGDDSVSEATPPSGKDISNIVSFSGPAHYGDT